ncbi:protein DOWNY MILDEW RESISTANCE 6-like [Salvia miltiorrhiza]|uniref:protein DOWNY MILDEW RESISTANCE 6-like n=1 Tax=Salvia miltiorrhiza TaxID=226208 RepID=UPI0025ACA1F3|nr:protein DOWNY MILDEW RESISTANCE 6-like [Salvia miltiorrhiza]XP_057807410.1 protein DOWNY MILDEW RESISTANCE 6-like [Salvia miltiorrhiza]XP_057807411.1 protein DOWNY MILDEW RESISTANCE 6-like [Salvia miltiorrhiza]XP_057807413.1 protein DOWNY MILDEW RESISTANCE 6-like [Salvia miltiorrhiza]
METKVISGVEFSSLPSSYIRPESDRPKLSEVTDCDHVPVIDLSCEDRGLLVKQIGDACQEYGFFQVINHAVPKELVDSMVKVAHEFFNLSVEEKMKLYSDDPSKPMRLSTSFNVRKETVHNWRDYFRLHCYPLEKYAPEWPSNPASFKDIVSAYCKEVRGLGFRLQEAISESLGLQKDSLKDVLGEQGQHMAINYYPSCPQPDLTYGLPAHTDPNALTILLQDMQVSGLQVLKDGKWLAIKPQPDAFVINLGDQIQALSNGKYKSVWHRAVVNANKVRLSVASFLCPCDSANISAPKELITGDDRAIYTDFTYAEYYKKFWSRNLDQEHCLELFKN